MAGGYSEDVCATTAEAILNRRDHALSIKMDLCSTTDEACDAQPIEDRWPKIVKEVKDEYLAKNQRYPWIIGFSGGKDSTLVAHAVFEALLDTPPSKRTRHVYIVSNDTMVESPLVIAHLDEVTSRISQAATSLGLPITVARTLPEPDKTFWVLLIGKGYPSPNMTMRWCTDRLKIQPTSSYIKKYISKAGAAIVVLGVRRDESQTRQRSIDKQRKQRGSRLIKHKELLGAYIFSPIVDLSLDDVWEILGYSHAPWGGTHSDLIRLYRDAAGGECPVVLSQGEAAGCGTSSSRFGCWTCTVVEKDKSLQGFIDAGKHQYKPLVNLRDWLRKIRNEPSRRQAIRRNGKLTFGAEGNHIPGPFTIQTRKEILERLLKAQEESGDKLITDEELDLIYQNWAQELQNEKGVANG